MRKITVTLTDESGALLASKTFRVPDETRRLEIVDAEPFEGDYKPLTTVRIDAPQEQARRGLRRRR